MAACRSTMSLASAFAHVLLPEGRRRVLLIKLNPSPLCVTKCLTHVWIVTALEYSCYPSDVGHWSSEAPLAYGSEFCVKLMMHRSHALIDPPLASCASSIPGPPYLTIGVVFIANVGYGLIFRYRIKFDDGQVAIILAFLRHQHLVQLTPLPRWLMACPPKKARAQGVPQVSLHPRVDQKVSCPSNARNAPSEWR
jgi:hypothetical protein